MRAEALARAKAAPTIEFVEGVVAQGERVIVFSAFDEPVKRIAQHFGDQAVLLTGVTPTAKWQQLVDRFRQDEGVRVFVADLVAGGVGLDLTAARQVVFNDLYRVPANHWQAEDHAYRIGQTGTVNVTRFSAAGTVDEFVSHALPIRRLPAEGLVALARVLSGPVPERYRSRTAFLPCAGLLDTPVVGTSRSSHAVDGRYSRQALDDPCPCSLHRHCC